MTHVVVTLVHGTFSPNAPWVRPGSYFRNELTRLLGGDVDFDVFEWSGRNSHAARVRAGEACRLHLIKTISTYPTSTHVIVAHSHGGNVARYALRDDVLARRVAGLVCLATPFVVCAPREEAGLSGLFVMALAGLPFLLIGAAFLAMTRDDAGSATSDIAFAVIMTVLGALVLVRMIGLERAFRPFVPLVGAVFDWNERQRARLVAALTVKAQATPVLCVRASGDEASWALTRIDASTELPFATVNYVGIGLGVAALGAGYAGLLAAYLANWFAARWIQWVMSAGIAVIAVATALAFAYLVFMSLLPTVRVPVFGWENLFDLWRCRIRVEAWLTGSDGQVYNLAPAHDRSWWSLRLEHCSVYDDSAVISDVADWIRAHAGRRARR